MGTISSFLLGAFGFIWEILGIVTLVFITLMYISFLINWADNYLKGGRKNGNDMEGKRR